jgi:hypothetical protein
MPVGRFHDRHRSGLAEQLREPALMARIQVLDQHECHAGVGRDMREELGEGLETAR